MELRQFAIDLVAEALKSGADEADVFIQSGRESEISTRMSKVENIKQAKSEGYGIRVFKNKQLGFCFSSDFSPAGMRESALRAVNLSAETSSDKFNGLPDHVTDSFPAELDLFDPEIEKLDTDWKIDTCLRMEKAMLDYDKRVINSEGAGFYDGENRSVIANSRGLSGEFRSSYCYLSCSPVASEDGKMQGGYWYSLKRHLSDLDSPEEVGRTAAERAVRMLGARVPKTGRFPVIFDHITGASLLGSVQSAVNGDAVYKKSTYLIDKIGEAVASPLVTIVDDGTVKRGPASAPFDGEGIPTSRREIISRGNLKSYIYDTYTARKAGTESTGNAQRDSMSLPSIGSFNFYMESGNVPFDELINSTDSGLYLTNLMGFGSNPVTGDYSLGASGIWIESGKLAYPVEGLVISSNMLEMLKKIDMIGNDLKFMGPISCPTFRVSEMTISGSA